MYTCVICLNLVGMKTTPSSPGKHLKLTELKTACAYWRCGMQHHEAIFYASIQQVQPQGEYWVACGLKQVIDALAHFQFPREDLMYYSSLVGQDGEPLLDPGFLEYLLQLEFSCTLHAVPEGTLVFAHEPLLRIQGPLIQCVILESLITDQLSIQSGVASAAARLCRGLGENKKVLVENPASTSWGKEAELMLSRAAYIGGCGATTSLQTARTLKIPLKSYQPYHWFRCFDEEKNAMLAYAQVMPGDTVLAIDAHDFNQGLASAIEIAQMMGNSGFQMAGIQLGRGVNGILTGYAREQLNQAGLKHLQLWVGGQLGGAEIAQLIAEGIEADVWIWDRSTGLDRSYDPHLCYELAALRAPKHAWTLHQTTSTGRQFDHYPGRVQVRRFMRAGKVVADVVFNELWEEQMGSWEEALPSGMNLEGCTAMELLNPIFDNGQLVYLERGIQQKRTHTLRQIHAYGPRYSQLDAPLVIPDPLIRTWWNQRNPQL